jgi:hypothetical protein
MVLHLSAAKILLIGLHHAGFDDLCTQRNCAATNLRRFRASFGASPQSCSKMFTDLQTMEIHAANTNKPNPVFPLAPFGH